MRTFLRYTVIVFMAGFLSKPAGAKQVFRDNPVEYWQKIANATGKDKVKLLNRLAVCYINTDAYRPDSALHYAEQSLAVARSVNDPFCYATTAELCGNISLQLSYVTKGLGYYSLARRFALQFKHQHLLAVATRGVGQALWYNGKFGQAIDTIRQAIAYFRELHLDRDYSDATMALSSIYGDMGNYEKAFEVAQQSLELSQAAGDQANTVLSLTQLGYLYKNIGDYATAFEYFSKAFACRPPFQEWCYRLLCNRVGDLYTEQNNFDSAHYFYRQSLSSHADSKTAQLRMADYWLALGNYQKAEDGFAKVYAHLKNTGEGNLLVFALIGLGKTAIAKNDLPMALRFGYEALEMAQQRDTRLTLRDAYRLLYAAYDGLHNGDSAYAYYKKFVAEKDAIVSDQFKGKLFAYKQATQLQLLANEKLLAEQKLRGNQQLRNLLIGGIGLLALLGLIVIRNIQLKRKNEMLRYTQLQAALKQRAAEMEMQALRAQMNPHFIFNALSSINRFILKNDAEKASDYLTRFSRLIRLVLVNSQRNLVSLEEELEMLQLYLQMESLRFKHAFTFDVTVDEDLTPSAVYLPPLLLQPFCENAIWHGLMHREKGGRLEVWFKQEDDHLHCIVADNGIGRTKAGELASKSAEKIKSLGLQLTRERLALFNEGNLGSTAYEIEDIVNEEGLVCGTTVSLRIKHKTVTQIQKPETVC